MEEIEMRRFLVWYLAFAVILFSGLSYGQNRSIKGKEIGKKQLYKVKQPYLKLNVETGKSWIKIKLVDKDGQPVQGERYRIELPDGTVRQGILDSKGQAHIGGIDPGNCQITFPNLDKDAWERE
jgi:hypothetical protein